MMRAENPAPARTTQRAPGLWRSVWRPERGLAVIALLWLALLPIGLYRVYATDEVQYFAYLRSAYMDGDLDFANEYEHFAELGRRQSPPDLAVYNALLRPHPVDPPLNPQTGKYRNVAPVGAALLWSPFYVLADGLVRLNNALGGATPADGYSQPYIVAVCLASACYTLLGLLLSYRLARRWAGQWAATAATLAIWLASPLIFYTYIQMPWSHGTSFGMVALFLTVWLGPAGGPLLERRGQLSWRRWLALGVIGGLLTMTREQMGLFLLLPAAEALLAYWALARDRSWRALRQLLGKHVAFVLIFALTTTPQWIAYTILNGAPRPSSTVAGKFILTSPHFFATLLDPAHGAFLWSPVLALGLLGLIWLARRDRLLAALLLLGFVAQTYINGSFGTTWHLSRSFGFRRLLECTPIFIIGLALIIERLRAPRLLVAGAALLLVLWNGGLIAQWTVTRPALREGLIWDGMLKAQLDVPATILAKADKLLFGRCEFVTNCQQ